jgi:hypothetical protein
MTSAEIEAERERLIGQLWQIGHRIGMPTEAGQRARSDAIEAIRRRLDALPPKPYTPIGMEAGTLWVGGLLGSMPARPEPPEPESWRDERDFDPWRRFSEEG